MAEQATLSVEPAEGKWTRKARLRLAKVTQLEHKIRLAKTQISNLEIELYREIQPLKVELTEAKRAGEWDIGWGRWWLSLGIPDYERQQREQNDR